MKILFILCFPFFAQASELVDLSDRISNALFHQEDSLSHQQRLTIKSKLKDIEYILQHSGGNALTCVRYSHNYLGFAVTDLNRNSKLSILVNKEECERLLSSRKNNLLCVKESHTNLGFKAYSLILNRSFGIGSTYDQCRAIVSNQRNGYFCQYQSHTTFGFILTRLRDGVTFGKRQDFKTCLAQIPN